MIMRDELREVRERDARKRTNPMTKNFLSHHARMNLTKQTILAKQAEHRGESSNTLHHFFVFYRAATTPYEVGGQPYFLGLSHVGSCKENDNSQECEGAPQPILPPARRHYESLRR